MKTGIFVNFRWLCMFAGWDHHLLFAGDEEVYVQADGDVCLVHKGHDIHLGRLTETQVRAVFAWRRDPGVCVQMHVLCEIVGWDEMMVPCDSDEVLRVRPHGAVVIEDRDREIQLALLNAQQLETVADWRRRGDLPTV